VSKHYIPNLCVPGTQRKLLTDTAKMPSASWSLPAREACPYAFYGEGTICGDCYATKGSYTQYPNVLQAQRARFEWVRECLKTPEGTDSFVQTMVYAIRKAVDGEQRKFPGAGRYFRVHDAGDLFSPAYTWAWVRIVQALPDIKFWFPTRSWRPLKMAKISPATRMAWELALMALAAEPNVTVRPSALFFNAPAPRIPGLAAGSTASDADYSCPASQQNNECGDCRACWDAPDMAISYRAH
jgi:Gene product 88